MLQLLFFALLSIPIVILSWKPLMNPKSHGFYRFFGWEGIAWLFACNYSYWFVNPLSMMQIGSWLLLAVSIVYVAAGTPLLIKSGKPTQHREDVALYSFEKTTELVETGIYKYIRHPLYGSLIFLTWGIFLKHISFSLFVIMLITTVFFYITARVDEKECRQYFGEKYAAYMKRSRMFIPLIF